MSGCSPLSNLLYSYHFHILLLSLPSYLEYLELPARFSLPRFPQFSPFHASPGVGIWGLRKCLCWAGVSSCVPSFFLAGFRWAGTLSAALLALPVFRLLKEFLLSGPLKIFTVLDIFESPILCWSSADKLKCVGGKMVRKGDCVHVNLIFIWNQTKNKVQSTWMCENKQVTLCTWLV